MNEKKFSDLPKYKISNMFTLEQIRQAHSQVKCGADFPLYIQSLQLLGVNSYEVSLRDALVRYFGENNYEISDSIGIAPLIIASVSHREQFISDLKSHQNGNTDYQRFCHDCAKSGIGKWIMNLSNMTCTYYDNVENEILAEKIPG